MRLALYQPEIPQNTGTLMRLCGCMGIPLDIIHPCGFVFDNKHLRRAGMDYTDLATLEHHTSWDVFQAWVKENKARLILIDTEAEMSYTDFQFQPNDVLLMGQESSGVPKTVFDKIEDRLLIPMVPGCRSLNVSLAAAMVLGEALRQINLQKKAKK